MSNGKWQKFRDDVDHPGHKIDWGEWAIAGDDHEFGGRGNRDSGER
jgi:alpha-amylase